jgi:hypothetical protein
MLDLARKVDRRFFILIWVLALMLGSRPRSVCGFKGRFFWRKKERMCWRWALCRGQSIRTCFWFSIAGHPRRQLGSASMLILWVKEFRWVWPERDGDGILKWLGRLNGATG